MNAAAAVLLEPGLFEPVAPGRVLERMAADRRPEPGHGVPLRRLAGGAPTRDLALTEGVAPVLDSQCAAGRRILGERDVAGGVEPGLFGAHARVDGNGAIRELEPRGGGELGAGRDAGGHHHDLPRRAHGSRSDLERAVARGDLFDLGAEVDVDAFLHQPAADVSGRFETEASRVGLLLVGDQRDRVAPAPERGGDLAADEARADHDHGVSVAKAGDQLAHVVERADHPHRWVVGTRYRQPGRLGPGREHAASVAELATAGQRHRATSGIEHRPRGR